MRIGILGGGSVGTALAGLFRKGGHDVLIGQREASQKERQDSPPTASMQAAASHGEVVICVLPFSATLEVVSDLAQILSGKIVVDVSNPVNADWSPMLLGAENSAGEEVARALPGSRTVKAFNTIFADVMAPERQDRGGRKITAFVAGDDAAARETVAALAADAGFAPVVAGPMRLARHLEAMAHLNIHIAVSEGGGTDAAFLYDQRRD